MVDWIRPLQSRQRSFEAFRTLYEPAFRDKEIERNQYSLSSGSFATMYKGGDAECGHQCAKGMESKSSAYSGLKKFYETLSQKETHNMGSSVSSGSVRSSSDDALLAREIVEWYRSESEGSCTPPESICKDEKDMKKWLKGSKKLLADLQNPKRKNNWPPSEEMERAHIAVSLASEAVRGRRDTNGIPESRHYLLSIGEGEFAPRTSSNVRSSASLPGFDGDDWSRASWERETQQPSTLKGPSKTKKPKSLRKPQFSNMCEVIPDGAIVENMSVDENLLSNESDGDDMDEFDLSGVLAAARAAAAANN